MRRTCDSGRGPGATQLDVAGPRRIAVSVKIIANQALELAVVPDAGASIAGLTALVHGTRVPILRPTPDDAIASLNSSLFACFALVPWSNRLADARFAFAGRTHQLRANTPEGYAIHGDVRKRPWRVVAETASTLELAFASRDFGDVNFPFPFEVTLRYALDGATLAATIALTSRADEAMPAGMGFHPYYRRTLLDDAEQVEIRATAPRAYRELVPVHPAVAIAPDQDFSRGRALGDQDFDTCFAGWDGKATITWPGSRVRAHVACDATLDHMILFAPPGKPFFALEPVSNANNGFNLAALGDPDAGVRVLAPGETLRGTWRLTVEG
jgi:aldose 1-epimerase